MKRKVAGPKVSQGLRRVGDTRAGYAVARQRKPRRVSVAVGTVTVTLPPDLSRNVLTQPADPASVITEAVRVWSEQHPLPTPVPLRAPCQQILDDILREAGLLIEEDSSVWEQWLDEASRITHQQLRQRLAGTPPLSELIIAERNEGR